MPNCPVCDTPLSENICPECGFDRSRHYEAFPTFAPVPAANAVSRLRGARENVIRCAKCGGTSFSLQAGTMLPVCRRCGAVFTPPQPEKPAETPKTPKQPHGRADEIVSVAGGFDHTVVLYGDGHVRAVGSNEFGQCDTYGWKDITAIAAARGITLGLREDGTVSAACNNSDLQRAFGLWRDVRAIAVSPSMAAALHADGSISLAGETAPLAAMPKVRFPGGKLALGHRHLVLLSPTGTVTACGDNSEGQCNVSGWKNIIAVAAGEAHTVGLKRDGTLVATGRSKEGQCRTGTLLAPWKNIKAIAAGSNHTVALRADGTVLCCGSSTFGKCHTRKWAEVLSIAAGALTTLALTGDGKVLVAGWQAQETSDALSRLSPL